jgi:hypothetical protein
MAAILNGLAWLALKANKIENTTIIVIHNAFFIHVLLSFLGL